MRRTAHTSEVKNKTSSDDLMRSGRDALLACTCSEYDVPVCAAYWRTDAVSPGNRVDVETLSETSCDMKFTHSNVFEFE